MATQPRPLLLQQLGYSQYGLNRNNGTLMRDQASSSTMNNEFQGDINNSRNENIQQNGKLSTYLQRSRDNINNFEDTISDFDKNDSRFNPPSNLPDISYLTNVENDSFLPNTKNMQNRPPNYLNDNNKPQKNMPTSSLRTMQNMSSGAIKKNSLYTSLVHPSSNIRQTLNFSNINNDTNLQSGDALFRPQSLLSQQSQRIPTLLEDSLLTRRLQPQQQQSTLINGANKTLNLTQNPIIDDDFIRTQNVENNKLNDTQNMTTNNINNNTGQSITNRSLAISPILKQQNASLFGNINTNANVSLQSTQSRSSLGNPNLTRIVRSPNEIAVVGFPSNDLSYIHRKFTSFGSILESHASNNVLYVKYSYVRLAERALAENGRWIIHDGFRYVIAVMYAEDIESEVTDEPSYDAKRNFLSNDDVENIDRPLVEQQSSLSSKFLNFLTNGW